MAAIRPKVAYYAVQNIASIFDSNMLLNPRFKCNTGSKMSMSVYGFQHKQNMKQAVAIWIDSAAVTNSFQTTHIDFAIENSFFKDPVLVDLMTGNIYELPKKLWSATGDTVRFENFPVYDARCSLPKDHY